VSHHADLPLFFQGVLRITSDDILLKLWTLWTLYIDRTYLKSACHRPLNLLVIGTTIILQAIQGRNRNHLLECDGVLSGVKPRNFKRNVLTELQEYPKVSPKRLLIFTGLYCFHYSEIIILTDVAVRM